jgi:hypothetical protein
MKYIELFENFLNIPNEDQDYFLDYIEKGTCFESVYEQFKIYRFNRLYNSEKFDGFERQSDYYNIVKRLKNSNVNCYPLFNKTYMCVVFISEMAIQFIKEKIDILIKQGNFIDKSMEGKTVYLSWNKVALPIIENLCQKKDENGEAIMFESIEENIRILLTVYFNSFLGLKVMSVNFN